MTAAIAWSAGVLELKGGPEGALAVFQDSLPVQLIATPRQDFRTCRPDESLSSVVDRNSRDLFDFLPVIGPGGDNDETVAGVLEIAPFMKEVAIAQLVREHMQPLGEDLLIGSDASILTFIRDADRHPFRFVVSGRAISGLVSISDLQRLPVRTALFAIVTQLEMTMAEFIRRRFPEPDAWMPLLSDERGQRIRDDIATARSEDTLVDSLLYTQFCDKITIIHKTWLSSVNGSKTRFRKEMKAIESLRNGLAHANDYAATCHAARNVCDCVRKMDGWIRFMSDLSRELPPSASRVLPKEG